MRLSKELAKHYRAVHDLYVHKHDTDGSLGESVEWGIQTKRLQMSPEQTFDIHLSLMSSAMNADVTPSGQRRRCCMKVKTKADDGKVVQKWLWKLVHEAPRAFVVKSFEQRKDLIGKDVIAWRRDLDYANETLRARGKREIEIDLEFDQVEAVLAR